MESSNGGNPPKDTRFDLSIEPDREERLRLMIERTRELAKTRPLAAIKVCLDMERELRLIEKEAAHQAHGRYKVSWDRISWAFGKDRHWAYNRYVAGGLSHPKSRRKSTKPPPAEMEE